MAGVGLTGHTGEFLGDPSLLFLGLIQDPAAAWADSLFLLNRDLNISNSFFLSACVSRKISFSNCCLGNPSNNARLFCVPDLLTALFR